MRILKIGGALITDKSDGAFEVARLDVIESISRQLDGEVILVHGVGSFGHPHVKMYGLSREGVAKTHHACLKLNSIVCESLIRAGKHPLPVHPLEFFSSPDFDFLRSAVEEGFIPVMHGDIVYEAGRFRVMSGDEVVRILAEKLRPEAVGFASDTAVVVDGEVVELVHSGNVDSVLEATSPASGKADVTGGMRGKLEEALRIARICDVYIFSGYEKDAIRRFLSGEHVGTKVAKVF
ncbi:isopentenyl phosphate kinase [Geoglobus ahangari]|uniref:Isopentenyl phosphate kinase n=1 Tax=Geoglobus ahangari TaxID=113653 RepID=A0A0F7II50_9EURY|nr:isopentenyl phosphate kinase [Geoglobus ahangari]AKG92455.1 isopentenyl phosphate kinase [Geoglobus ahangari]